MKRASLFILTFLLDFTVLGAISSVDAKAEQRQFKHGRSNADRSPSSEGLLVVPYAPLKRRELSEEAESENLEALKQRYEQEQLTSPDERRQIYQHAVTGIPHAKSTSYQPWQVIGTGISVSPSHSSNYPASAGRVSAVQYAYDSSQGATVLWVSGAGGGLWKMVSSSWVPVSQTLTDPTVGAFLVDRTNSNHLIIGTGNKGRSIGSGMYASPNQGVSWASVPMMPTPSAFYRIVQDRTNASVILAATDTGLYRSVSGGAAWTRLNPGDVTDLTQDPATATHWYAGARGIGVLESTTSGAEFHPINGDGGVSAGLTGPIGRISLAVCDGSPNYIYAAVDSGDAGSGSLQGVFRSNDYGAHWVSIYADNANYGQHGTNLAIAVHPSDPNRVVVGLTYAEMTTNATSSAPTWRIYEGGHADYTSFLFLPQAISPGNTTLIATNDGGIYLSNYVTNNALNPPGDNVDTTLNTAGLNIEEQIFGYGDLAGSRSQPSTLLAGLVDNGIARLNGLSHSVESYSVGDGGLISISPDHADWVYYSVGLNFRRLSQIGEDYFNLDCNFDPDGIPPSVLIDPRPNLSAPEIFTISRSQDAVVSGREDILTHPLTADETLTITVNGIVATAHLIAGDTAYLAQSRVREALMAAGISNAQTALFFSHLSIWGRDGGGGVTISVVSDRGLGAGTTGFGTSPNTGTGQWGGLWYKSAATETCDWRLVGPAYFNIPPLFIANYIEKAMNPFYDVLYVTGKNIFVGDSRLNVYDSQVDGPVGAMTQYEDRTPPLATRTSARDDGHVYADHSTQQWDTVYYTTATRRPSQAFLSTNRGVSWSNVTGNLAALAPSVDYYQLIGNPANLNELFLGTSVGVFYSSDRGQHWESFNEGLPAVTRVQSLVLQSDNSPEPKLYIATGGQGFWSRSLGAYTIDSDISANWYNPQQSGHGMVFELINISGVPTVLVNWYVYLNGEQRWLYGTGPVSGNQVHIPLFITSGTDFPPNFHASAVQTASWGSLDLTFRSASAAHAQWSSSYPGFNNGSIDLVPIAPVLKPADDPAGAQIKACHSGNWYNTAESGHGFELEVITVNGQRNLLAVWYNYNHGEQLYLVGSGPIEGDHANVSFYLTHGGQFPPAFDAAQVTRDAWGTATFQFSDANHANVIWSPTAAGFSAGSLALTRLTTLLDRNCD